MNRGDGYGNHLVLAQGTISYHAHVLRQWEHGGYRLIISRDTSGQPATRLTAREHDILYWIRQGKSNSQIAEILGISVYTVKQHLKRIFDKLGVENRTAAASHVAPVRGECQETE